MASLAKEPEVSVAERLGLTGEPHSTAGLTERRRTDRRVQLEVVLAYLFCSLECPITDIAFPQSEPKDSTFGPLTCVNHVTRTPDFVTRNVISGHEVIFALLCAAVNRAQTRVLEYLERAEDRTPEIYWQQDLRMAQIIVVLASKRETNPYSKAFFQLWGKNAHQVRWWWRDENKLWQLAQVTNCPTPLLVANQAEEALSIIPDFDYSQVSRAHCPVRPGESPAHAPGRRTVPRSSLVQAVSGVGQGNQVSSGGAKGATSPRPDEGRRCSHVADPAVRVVRRSDSPLEKVSPVLPPPHVHAQPANRPAPSRAGAGFPKSRRTA